MKNNLTHQAGIITNATLPEFPTELSLAYKELQENKIFIQYLIDQIKALKKELQALKKITKRDKQSQQHLLAGISHEIRTPLHAIVGLSNTLKGIIDENDRKENIAMIENAAFVLGAMVSNILDAANTDSSNIKLNLHPFNLKALIKNLQTTFIYRLKNRPVEFRVEVNENVPEMAEGDEQKLLHVLLNLLDNAEKFTDSGWIKLSVAVVKSVHGKTLTAFTIEDTGRGLSSDNPGLSNQRLEDMIEKRTKLNREGLGFGLPVTKALIKILKGKMQIETDKSGDLMEGRATLESIADKGVKITIVLPLKRYSEKKGDAEIIPDEDEILLSRLKVLIAEDTNINRKYLAILLNKWNIPHEFVSNGEEAIENINTHDFNLVLMDINMPGLDGFETTKAIRKMKDPKKSSVPVIGVSASVLNEYKIRGKKVGMNAFLAKPFKPEQLKELLVEFAVENQSQSVPFINENMLRDYFGNDYAAAAAIFKIFIEESIPEIYNWEKLLQQNGARELGVRAHALKSSMAMLGLSSLSQKCFELEQACALEEDDTLLTEKIKHIKSEIRKTTPLLKQQFELINKMANKND